MCKCEQGLSEILVEILNTTKEIAAKQETIIDELDSKKLDE